MIDLTTFPENIIDNQAYQIEVLKNVHFVANTTRILIPTLILNDTAKEMVRVCVESIQKFTTDDVEIWLMDNNSPEPYANWLTQFNPDINVVLNRTEPINPFLKLGLKRKIRSILFAPPKKQILDGSYANAIALEIGRQVIPPTTQTIFTMHYDAIPTKYGWLKYLKSKLSPTIRAVGYRKNTLRVEAPHIAGLLLDYTLFEPLKMSFLSNMRRERFPNQPEYDAGDQIALQLKAHKFDFEITPNTFNTPQLIEHIPPDSPFQQMLGCDLCFDDSGDIFFMHMGRGVPKSTIFAHATGTTYPAQWLEFINKHIFQMDI